MLTRTRGRMIAALILGVWLAAPPASAECPGGGDGTGNKQKIVSAFEPFQFTDADSLDTSHGGLDDDMSDARLAKLPAERREFCARGRSRLADIQYMDQIGFANPPGKMGMGLCWWMSRFQRSINYTANYVPKKPKPTLSEAKKIIDRIVAGDEVTEIPGYWNAYQFTQDYKKEIDFALSAWQGRDAIKVTPGVDSLLRVGSESSDQLRERMSALYSRMLDHRAQLVAKIPIKGEVGATHGIVIENVEPLREGGSSSMMKAPVGYVMYIHDPNYPDRSKIPISYHFGDTTLHYPKDIEKEQDWLREGFLPNVDYDNELSDHENAIRAYCGRPKK